MFPGLGWMISAKVWQTLKPRWALAFWDEWMRKRETHHGRTCIYPEVNRVYTFGDKGNSQSGGAFWKNFLEPIQLNLELVLWTKMYKKKMGACIIPIPTSLCFGVLFLSLPPTHACNQF